MPICHHSFMFSNFKLDGPPSVLSSPVINCLDLPFEPLVSQFTLWTIRSAFFIGIQMQRITACFTSTTILAQPAFYIWTVEFFFKICLLFGSIALLSINKDLRDEFQSQHHDAHIATDHSGYLDTVFLVLYFGSVVVGVCLKLILNELRNRDKDVERQRESLLRIEKDMPPFPVTTAKSPASTLNNAQRQLQRVRTWPRVGAGLHFVLTTLATILQTVHNRDQVSDMPCKRTKHAQTQYYILRPIYSSKVLTPLDIFYDYH